LEEFKDKSISNKMLVLPCKMGFGGDSHGIKMGRVKKFPIDQG
jgi:hypothetical protein